MNTNPKRFETVDRFVNMNKETRLKLFGYLLIAQAERKRKFIIIFIHFK